MNEYEEQAFRTLINYYSLIVENKDNKIFKKNIGWIIFGIATVMESQKIINKDEFKRIICI